MTVMASLDSAIRDCRSHRRAGQFFSAAPEETAMLTCEITLPDSPHAVIISKNPGFRAHHLAGQNEFRFLV